MIRGLSLCVVAAVFPSCHGIPTPPTIFRITSFSLPEGGVGLPYSAQLTLEYGAPPYAWSLLGGVLPPGLTLDPSSGLIDGIPTQNGLTTFTVRATDGTWATANQTLSLQIAGGAPSPVSVSLTPLPDASQYASYDSGFSASGGLPPYAWTLTTGSPPVGIGFVPSSGRISGYPTVVGSSTFTIQVTDGSSQTATGTLSLTVHLPPTIGPSSLPDGTIGIAYSQGLSCSGGSVPYVWTITGGSLPPGLTLDATTGAIAGTPTAAGNFPFYVQVVDARQSAATSSLSLRIDP